MDIFESKEKITEDIAIENGVSDLTVKYDPWGNSQKEVLETRHACEMVFEDSFTSNLLRSDVNYETESAYIPLDDSHQYLESLQNKLARVQGKTKSQRENEIKKMINDLALSREDHTYNFLNSDIQGGCLMEEQDESDFKVSTLNTVDPQGPLGAMMRKLAPEHIALSEEELFELLKSDTLAKAYKRLQEDDDDEDSDSPLENNQTTTKDTEEETQLSEDVSKES